MKKKVWFITALLLLAAILAGGFFASRYVIVDLKCYPRDAAALDLRGQEISVSHYEKLCQKLPDTSIRWDIPFQDGTLADDTRELTVSSLSAEDAALLVRFLPSLRSVDGRACTEFDGLYALKQQRPGIQVRYWVPIGGTGYAASAIQISLDRISAEDLARLQYLPFLKTVTVTGGEPSLLKQLQEYCKANDIAIRLLVGGQLVPETAVSLEFDHITNGEADLMYLLPKLKKLHLTEPEAEAETLIRLREDLPGVSVSWEKTLLGLTFRQDVQEIDLTDIIALGENQQPGDETAYHRSMQYGIQGDPEEVPSAVKLLKHRPLPDKTAATAQLIEEAEAAMAYFPEAQKLSMYGSVLDNEAMAAFRDRHSQDYKVAWTVQCGKTATRTDATFFMPVKYHVYYLNDSEAANLRYCPEMIAVDIGHMNVSDISFVEYMPNLQYLILAHTSIRYIEPIRSCKNLKFLEVDHTGIQDFSPLLDCTALEDLNIGKTWNDVEPLKEMTWLKNLWMVFRPNSAPEMVEALPNTNVVYQGTATVDSGWRDLPNYFAMRDELLMFYMSW